MNKIDEIKKQLVWKIKDASNTNTIFDTRKYLLYEDVIEILNQALTIPVVVGQSEQLCGQCLCKPVLKDELCKKCYDEIYV